MNGEEVKKMLKIIQSGKKKYYLTSGIKQVLAKDKDGNVVGETVSENGKVKSSYYDYKWNNNVLNNIQSNVMVNQLNNI